MIDIRGRTPAGASSGPPADSDGISGRLAPVVGFLRAHRLWVVGLFALLLLGGGALVGAYAWFARDLPAGQALIDYQLAMPSTVRDRNGQILQSYVRERRTVIGFREFPPLLIGAFLSAEDKNFFRHGGVDYMGIVRAAFTNVTTSGRPQGASTITQQLAKNLLDNNRLSYIRKIREAILAYRIEDTLSKQRILELYLNQIPLGRNSFGVQAAAQAYFGRDVAQLSLAETAFLATLPKAPETYGRAANAGRAIARRNWVLGQMADNGYISDQQARSAQAEPLGLLPRAPAVAGAPPAAGYFTEEVRRLLIGRFGENADAGPNSVYGGGLWVRSSYDPALQAAAEAALRKGILRLGSGAGWRGPVGHVEPGPGWAGRFAATRLAIHYDTWRTALILEKSPASAEIGFADGSTGRLDRGYAIMPARDGRPAYEAMKPGDVLLVAPVGGGLWALRSLPAVSGGMAVESPHTGQVFALQGGFDAGLQAFNRATQALRQPGSAFKPFVYSAALEGGMTPASMIVDGPFCVSQGPRLGMKCFRNFDGGGGGGAHTMRWGVEQSRNLMTVRAASQTGMAPVVRLADRLGISAPGHPYPATLAISLGAGDTTVLRLVNAFAILANQGRGLRPTLIDYVQDRTGKAIWRADTRPCPGCNAPDYHGEPMPRPPRRGNPLMDPVVAYQMVHILEGVIQRGTATRLKSLNRPLFGKTGTTTGPTNVWFVGGSPDLIAGIYLGYDQPRPMGGHVQGGTYAAPVFGDFAQVAMADMPLVPFRAPPGTRLVRIDRRSGQPVYGAWPDSGSDAVIWEAFRPTSEAHRKMGAPPPLLRPVSRPVARNAPAPDEAPAGESEGAATVEAPVQETTPDSMAMPVEQQ